MLFQIPNKSYQQMQKIPRNAYNYKYNIVLFTYRYFTCFELEAVNLVQMLTVHKAYFTCLMSLKLHTSLHDSTFIEVRQD